MKEYFTIKSWAHEESVNSQLPGRENGPADAYRYILATAESTRLLHKQITRIGSIFNDDTKPLYEDDKKNGITYEMDSFNNRVGILIGQRSNSREDVI